MARAIHGKFGAKQDAHIDLSNMQPEERVLDRNIREIRTWLKKVHFRKQLFGGVKEADVWKKIGELNALYEVALSNERARYDALLEEQATQQKLGKMLRGSSTEQENAIDEYNI